MKVLVVGATGGTGRAAVEALVADGQRGDRPGPPGEAVLGGRAGVRPVDGDATLGGGRATPPSGVRTPSS